ncbi:hypothetical protein ASPVEDRAFT_49018 [Aspergillus versicolor CBS 583.65]|uniref:Malate dehydrogenase n=1 Tax=Aspergillus versicolor CBS 583.65 TaxID=1036611 RepID=A0A1L9P5Y5_ASPVE|nr:uncharacterized protein ASPVEDRAFT_49018 [Aspergillus versicolor CBS 583.65]OJI96929.1 hypothetical protein ASPVEDRAFT_49018 [Aspergillus versicolor CBS 583.65]
MRSVLFLTSCLAATSAAAPMFGDLYHFSDEMAEFLGRVGKRISDAGNVFDQSLSCDASSIQLPSFASSLPAPTDQKPLYVALGRGTQNYTCASSTSDSEPEAIGAVARLYNATCFASTFPDMIELLPSMAYRMNLPSNPSDPLPPSNFNLIGHHFFEGSVPVFNLDTPTRQLGIAKVKKESDLDAPSSAVKGKNGAVKWLLLSATNGTVGSYASVYRVDTAGGGAPKTCEGMPESFTVQYAANYYIYGQ